MKRAVFVMWTVVILSVLAAFVKQLGAISGVPNVLPALRDPLIIGLAIWAAGRLNLLASKRWALLIALLSAFAVSYIAVAMVEDKLFAGLYYLRVYLLPIVFFVGVLGTFSVAPSRTVVQSLRILLYWNAVLAAAALSLYGLMQVVPSTRFTLIGPGLLPDAWYISGGVWMRMGLPATSPNALGLVCALNAFVFAVMLLRPADVGTREPGVSRVALALGLGVALVALVMTFSRSSLLLLLVSVPLLLVVSGAMTLERLFKLGLAGLALLGLLVAALMVADVISDGYVTVWLHLNTRFQDPSMGGHASSVRDALENFAEYAFWGYPKGTVGPLAVLFNGVVGNNVENSLLGLLYDMGVLVGAVYVLAVAVLFSMAYRHPVQWPLLIGFSVPWMLLPHIFSSDAMMYFAFVYVLTGRLLPTPQPRSSRAAGAVLRFQS